MEDAFAAGVVLGALLAIATAALLAVAIERRLERHPAALRAEFGRRQWPRVRWLWSARARSLGDRKLFVLVLAWRISGLLGAALLFGGSAALFLRGASGG